MERVRSSISPNGTRGISTSSSCGEDEAGTSGCWSLIARRGGPRGSRRRDRTLSTCSTIPSYTQEQDGDKHVGNRVLLDRRLGRVLADGVDGQCETRAWGAAARTVRGLRTAARTRPLPVLRGGANRTKGERSEER